MKIDYDLLEDTQNEALLFVLQESEAELPLRRVNILLHACPLCGEKSLQDELYRIANELMDVDQEVQRLIGSLRERCAKEIGSNNAFEFLLSKIETAPVEAKIRLLDGAGLFHDAPGQADFTAEHMRCHERVNQWVQKYELLKFHIRTRHHEMSNAETIAKDKQAPAASTSVATVA
jgi:hypothetical protein